ncbi:VHS domain-containing protein [Crassisporium funariophilum]|nr:VHS domain-containing protein [Crassisporium funariophilum]
MLQSPTGPASWTKVSPIEILITRACEPSLHEPNYALHLEVAEFINHKKANTPREAAMTIARLANHRNPHIAILALALLDTLVQSCGYPFHLQISTKEFLNELVRRFPERPPPFPGPVMSRILELIGGWKEGLCVESRWKEDLGNIRDMHRLLTFKGYRFRDTGRGQGQGVSAAVAAAGNLKSAEELESEDREAQSAKLQELIRRGTPRDLAAAQELMKSLAGANPDARPDYRTQALQDLNRLESKVVLLNEMLDNVDRERGERFVGGDAYDQVSTILQTARPKLQKWISDAETDDPESLDTFLQINDQINTVLARYDAFKKGDFSFASNPIPKELAADAGSSQGVSLIDLDDEEQAGAGGAGGSLEDMFGGIQLGGQPQAQQVPQQQQQQQQQYLQYQQQQQQQLFHRQQLQYQQQQQHQQPQPQSHAPGGVGAGGSTIMVMRGSSTTSPPQSQSSQSGTPPAIRLPGSERSTPVPAPAGGPPGYFGNGRGMGVPNMPGMGGMGTPMGMGMGVPGMNMNMGMGMGVPGMGTGMPGMGMPGMMGMNMGMGVPNAYSPQPTFGGVSQQLQPQQQQQQSPPLHTQPAPAPVSTQSTQAAQGKDPFADLAGLF